MKKLYIFILLVCTSYNIKAQDDPDLLGTWYLHYIESNGNIVFVPSNGNSSIVQPSIIFSNLVTDPLEHNIEGDGMCNNFFAHYELPGNDTVTIPIWSTTLIFCDEANSGDSSLEQIEQYELLYFGILFDTSTTTTFNYTIDTTNNILMMVDSQGEKLVYGKQILSTKDNEVFSKNIQLYPNPAQKELFITGISINTKTSYSIYNLIGNTIISNKQLIEKRIDVHSLKAGTYFLKVSQNGNTSVKKFIKQ